MVDCGLHSALLLLLSAADFDFYACGSITKGWTPGVLQRSSGLLRQNPDHGQQWTTLGFEHPYINALAYDPRDLSIFYLASGNGLIKSRDRGEHWRVMTNGDMTEAQGVALDPYAPDHVFLALPDGIGYSPDGGATWTRRETGLKRKFTQVIRADRALRGHFVAGTESGVFVSNNNGLEWRSAGLDGAMVFDLAQSPHDPKRWFAVTQDGRAFESLDNGALWRTLATPKAHTFYNISLDPTNKLRVALGGWNSGVTVSEDGGKTWTPRNDGLPSNEVWRVAYHPGNGSLHAYVHEKELYTSNDNGRTWRPEGLPGGVIRDLAFVPTVNDRAYERRRAQLMRHMAGPKGQTDPNYGGYTTVAAKLYLKEDLEWSTRRLHDILQNPSGDMFWMFMVTAIQFLDRGQLPQSSRDEIRKAWKTYFPYRGDTENHWLLYYASLYLSSQIDPDAQWFTGKTSKENMREAAEYIRSWMDLTLAKGQGEYDCTHYIGVYLLPLSYLAAWAEDPDLRQRSRMMIEYIEADFAAELLDGVYVGAHARTDDVQVLEKANGVSTDLAWLLFGQGPDMKVHAGYTMYYALAWGKQPPPVLQAIATDRSKPYTHRERKRTRNRWRFHDDKNGPVYKTTYMTSSYAVGSDQGGVLQPIQQHSWDVTWRVADPTGVHNTLFTTHPYSSGHELQTYFTPMPDYFLDEVLRSKKTYDSPDKWIGGSPYEKILQDLDTVVVLYDIPEGVRHPHIHGFFSKDLAKLEEDESGWIFAQGGDAYIAYLPLAPYRWNKLDNGGRELFSPHLRNGAIVQTADRAEFRSFDGFKARIRALRVSKTLKPTPTVDFVSLRGRRLQFTFGQTPSIAGKPLDYANWPPFDGPSVKQAPGARRLELRHEKIRRVLDFDNLTIIEDKLP
jgi:photosystem II stability/assembly factor-like uncharacterized protein